MLEEQGVTVPLATEQPAAQAATGVNTQLATETVPAGTQAGVNQPAQDANAQQAPVQAAPEQPQAVPYDRFKEVNDKFREVERENQLLKLQQQLLQQQQPQAQPQAAQSQTSLFDQVVAELGLENEEFLNREQQGQVYARMNQITQAQTQHQIAEQQFLSQHTDFAEVVGAKNPITGQFVPSEHFTKVLIKNPLLGAALQTSPYAYALAYQVVANDPDYVASKAKPRVDVAAAAAQVLRQVNNGHPSISTVQGGGNLDKQKMVANMTDEEFAKYKAEIVSRAR